MSDYKDFIRLNDINKTLVDIFSIWSVAKEGYTNLIINGVEYEYDEEIRRDNDYNNKIVNELMLLKRIHDFNVEEKE